MASFLHALLSLEIAAWFKGSVALFFNTLFPRFFLSQFSSSAFRRREIRKRAFEGKEVLWPPYATRGGRRQSLFRLSDWGALPEMGPDGTLVSDKGVYQRQLVVVVPMNVFDVQVIG